MIDVTTLKVGDKVKINKSCAYGYPYLNTYGFSYNEAYTVHGIHLGSQQVGLVVPSPTVFKRVVQFLAGELDYVYEYNVKDWNID